MNDTLEAILSVVVIIICAILFVLGVVFGSAFLYINMEQSVCDDLILKGHDAKMVEDHLGKSCRLIYRGVLFHHRDLEEVLLLKLIDATEKSMNDVNVGEGVAE